MGPKHREFYKIRFYRFIFVIFTAFQDDFYVYIKRFLQYICFDERKQTFFDIYDFENQAYMGYS